MYIFLIQLSVNFEMSWNKKSFSPHSDSYYAHLAASIKEKVKIHET